MADIRPETQARAFGDDRVAELSRTYGNATMRATNDQNLVLPFIPNGD